MKLVGVMMMGTGKVKASHFKKKTQESMRKEMGKWMRGERRVKGQVFNLRKVKLIQSKALKVLFFCYQDGGYRASYCNT